MTTLLLSDIKSSKSNIIPECAKKKSLAPLAPLGHYAIMVHTDADETFSAAEELAHSLTHGAGLLLGMAALVLLYASSTLYHALPAGRGKRVFGILDHAAIFLLIAGTYTPFALVTLSGGLGWSVFAVIWGLAVAGIVVETISRGRVRRIQLGLYLIMGWGIIVAARPLLEELPLVGFALLLAGGLAYTVGVIFFVWKRPYHHVAWHVFVLAGSICHFFAVLLYVIP
jgi:hemolysin III